MKIIVSVPVQDKPIRVISLEGALDGSNFECLIDEAQKQYTARVRNLVLDLDRLNFISSAGLSAIHQVALIFRDKKPARKQVVSWDEFRWDAYRQGKGSSAGLPHRHVKLLCPSANVRQSLDTIGFTPLFEIFEDLQQALASFRLRLPAAAS